ncbi:MAG: YceD family protein [Acidobacteriota bacterium]
MDFLRLSDILEPMEMVAHVPALSVEVGYHYTLELEPLDLRLSVAPAPKGYRLKGGFPFQGSLPCSRCLRPVALSGEASFDLEFRPSASEEKVSLGGEAPGEPDVVYYEEDRVAFAFLVQQQIFLEIPEKVLCRENCPGLCPRCGKDLNEGPCGCPPEGDPRWDALSRLSSPQ